MQFPPNDHCGCKWLWYVPFYWHTSKSVDIYSFVIIPLITLTNKCILYHSTTQSGHWHSIRQDDDYWISKICRHRLITPRDQIRSKFVHDSRLIGQSSVNASIKLWITATDRSSMAVARSMEVSRKKTTASFKALNGTILTVNRETGERVTLSHTCTELDNSIPTYLGMSKCEFSFVCLVMISNLKGLSPSSCWRLRRVSWYSSLAPFWQTLFAKTSLELELLRLGFGRVCLTPLRFVQY
jgi:hypothetical protein